jgi:hypothetical protein
VSAAAVLAQVALGGLGLDRGGHLLIDRALGALSPGERLLVTDSDENLALHLRAWGRARGHGVDGCVVVKGGAGDRRMVGAVRAGGPGRDGLVDRPPASWGLAARGALVEAGGPDLASADLASRPQVWSDIAPKLYAQAAASQWDPATAIDWAATESLTTQEVPDEIEGAVVQVMTYLIENEQAALKVPARFLGRIHPHFREAVQLLAVQLADEARHVEVFTRRAQLRGFPLGVSGAGGRASLQTLLDEPDWSLASFLLSVLGEGTFLSLLSFLERAAPDPVTRQAARLVLQDEARHVAFGLAHLTEEVASDPGLRDRLRAAIERRHDTLASTSGLASDVHDSLVILAAGSWEPAAVAAGWDKVQALQADMDDGRRHRLVRLGFTDREASELSALHTKNFM